MDHRIRLGLAAFATVFLVGSAVAQPRLTVNFKFVPRPTSPFVSVFLPGEFNGWGPNAGGFIAPGAPSEMTFDPDLQMWMYEADFPIVQPPSQAQYKLHFHLNESGTDYRWYSDPANPITNPDDNGNSVLTVTDPMIFQMDYRVDADGKVTEVSAGVFGTQQFVQMGFSVNGDSAAALGHYDAAKGIFRYSLPGPAPPNSLFSLLAVDASGDSVYASIGSLPVDVEDVPRPPGLQDGINLDPSDPSRVTLSLFAPGKHDVYVLGDFNDWKRTPEHLMKRDSLNADSVYFWTTLDGLTPGVEYGFQYLIDGVMHLGDPYSHRVRRPSDANFPTGATSEVVSVFQTAQLDYEWAIESFQRPPLGELVIYELLVRDFVAAHDYATLIDTLDYLDRLGVNAIELMPISEYSGNSSWGYDPIFHLAPDQRYGPAVDLKRFIDACHQRGIAVLLDVVYNHNAYEAPFSRMYNESPAGIPGLPPTPDNPWLNVVSKHPFNVFNDVNHESSATKYWLDRANEFWLTEFKVDGFRFDLSKGFTQVNTGNDVGAWGRYDPSRIALLERMADQIWTVDSTAIIILEHFSEDREERELARYGMDSGYPGMLVWNGLNHVYGEATMGYNRGSNSDFSRVYYGVGGRNWPIPHIVSFMESHDEQWLMFKNRRYGACSASPIGGNRCNADDVGYNTRDVPIALDRMKMAGAFFLTVPGPKMIWQFGELGYGFGPDGRDCLRPGDSTLGNCPPGTPARIARKPIRWEYRDDPLREKLYKTWSELLRLRSDYDVLRSPDTDVKLALSGGVKRITMHHPKMSVAIMGNFGVTDVSGSFLDVEPGTWYNFFKGGEPVVISDPAALIAMGPGEFFLLTSIPVEPAEEGLITVAAEPMGVLPASELFDISSYPNPVSTAATIELVVPAHGHVRLELYDVLGRLVETLIDEELTPGQHQLDLRPAGLPAGMYFLKLSTARGQKTIPLVQVAPF